ncbi:hypothetical protein [uncultured Desulfovibrio sp.]|uniref:AEC family transporter n=1 Tax=uncultured Desulfovibrio sp. TaxID=167968 RepID=UPI002611F3AE|nr:hypothetical protein [uncultured Desulfovibrio sp.]
MGIGIGNALRHAARQPIPEPDCIVMDRLLLSLCLIFISLAAGYAAQRLLRIPRPRMETVRRRMQSLAVFCLIPCSAMLSLWGLPAPDPRLLTLPLLGITAWIWGGFLSLQAARRLRLEPSRTGSFYCCGTFSNLGAVGALVSVLFFGEKAIAIVALFRLCEEMFYFGIAFPVARHLGGGQGGFHFRSFRPDPVLLLILTALGLGLVLNVLDVPRPASLGPLASAAMLLATVLFLFAIGLGLRPSRISCYTREAAALAAVKFIGVPALLVPLAGLAGLGGIDGGLPLRVVTVLSCMPVAMTALVPPVLFRLDVDLANALWIFSTLALIIILPVLYVVLPLL